MSAPVEPARPRSDADSSVADLPSCPFSEAGVEAAAIRGRVAQSLFGEPSVVVRIGRYEVGDRIGVGGMGVVYSARDPELGRLVALKVLSSRRSADPRQRERLIGEARTLARLSHPNVVQIYEVGEHEGSIFLALEFVQGETMATWQRRPGRSWQEVLSAYLDAARGLAAAHQVGVVHGDVKPANILIGVDGRVRVVDFGLARDAGADEASTQSEDRTSESTTIGPVRGGAIAGTPAYMAPEQARGRGVDARSDLFSLCVSLFEGLHDIRPYGAKELQALGDCPVDARGLRALVQRRSAAPSWVLKVLTRGLEPDPRRRFADINALIAAFTAAPQRRRRRIVAGTVGLVLAVGAVWGALGKDDPECPALIDPLHEVWDPMARDALHARFLASGLPYADTAFDDAARSIDTAVEAWRRARRSLCLRGDGTAGASDERAIECIDAHERSIRDVIGRLESNEPGVISRAHELVNELGDPSVCGDPEALREGPTPLPVRALRERVSALRGALDEIRAQTILGAYEEARTAAEELILAAAFDRRLRAEAMLNLGIVLGRLGELESSEAILAEALGEAESLRDDHLAAAILGAQTELQVAARRDVARARGYAELYIAKLRRIGADAPAWAELHDRIGELEYRAGRFEVAIAEHNEALQRRDDEDAVGRAASLLGAARALGGLGRADEADTHLHEARALLVGARGEGHPDVATIDVNLALDLLERPDPTSAGLDRARELLEGALANALLHEGEEGLGTARARVVLALALDQLGDPTAAEQALMRALPVLRKRLPPTHDDLAEALEISINVEAALESWAAAADACAERITIHRARGTPVPFELSLNAGEFLLNDGRAIEAIAHYDRALALASLDTTLGPEALVYALNGRAKVHLEQGEVSHARGLFDRALELLPEPETTPAPAQAWLRAEVEWGAAQALASARHHREARRLATSARRFYAARKPLAPELAAIDGFLGRAHER